jgi:signal transduction histidine kinase
LRNPLQSITGEIYLAKTEANALPSSNHKMALKESIENMEEQLAYMNKIVLDLQDFVRPITVETTSVDVAKVIKQTLQEINIPESVRIELEMGNSPTLSADAQHLKRAFTNLLNNAVESMPEGGKLTLQLTTIDNKLKVIIKDTGMGIPETAKSKIFQPLFTTKSKGQGFGLAVCKRMIEANGGTISFESKEGKGTTFTIELPTEQLLTKS